MVMISALTACFGNGDTADSQTSAGLAEDAVLEISGQGISITLSADDMLSKQLETFSCDHIDSTGEVTKVTVSGFSLANIFQENGISLDDTASLNLIGSDGYIMSAPAEEYAQSGVYILLNYEGDDLSYPRSCIPDRRAMYWVRDLSKIEVVMGGAEAAAQVDVTRIDMFREGAASMEGQKLNNFGFMVNSYSLKDYFEEKIGEIPIDPLKMIAADGFEKSETSEVFFQNYITLEAEEGEEGDLPLYFSDTISDGMRVKQLDYVIAGTNSIYFGEGITVKELFEAVGMIEADSYSFIASDGFEVVVPKDALEFGIISKDEEGGYIRADFEGYEWGDTAGKGKVKHLTTIIADGYNKIADSGEAAETAEVEKFSIKCFVGGEKAIVTEEDFLALPQSERTITKTNSKGETTTALYKGVHWTDIAAFIGADPMTDVVLVASDGYEMNITSDMLNDPNSLFALYQDGELIASEGDGHIWFCASENFTANNWVKYITKIIID